jgi:NADPH2:quinone reductase
MKIIFNKIGNDRKLDLVTQEIFNIGEEEVLVKNNLIGFNPVDYKIFEGENLLSQKIKDKLPWTPGFDIAGVVQSVGSDVQNFVVGDRVCGMIGFPLKGGAYATYSVCRYDELVPIPKNVSYENAIYSCLSGLTAIQAYKLSSDSPQLILGSTGSVGTVLLQILSQKNSNSFYSYRRDESKKLINSFPNSIPISIDDLIKEKKFSSGKFGFMDLVGGEIAMQVIKQYQDQLTSVVTVPTYSANEIEQLCEKYKVDFKHFVVKPNTNQTKELLSVFKENNFSLPAKTFKLNEVEKLFDFYLNHSNLGKISIDPR